MSKINSDYYSDKPHSFGGKYRLYEFYSDKKKWIVIFLVMIYTQDLNSTDVQKNILQFMFIEKGNFFNQMWFSLQIKTL